jgi:uncharacterized membrane protein YfcA
MFDHHILYLIILFSGGLLAGTVDAIAGGGGLISLPLLVSVGLPPHIALGTNKLQSSVGTLIATYNYFRNGLISFGLVWKGLICGGLGAAAGALTAQWLSADFLAKALPFLLLAIFIYTLYTPKLGLQDIKQRIPEELFYMLFGFGLSFYDGFAGPGTGSFWAIAMVYFLGYNLVKATAYTKLFNLESNLVALTCFILGHNVNYKIGLTMACGQVIGGKLGSHLVIKKGARFVRPLFLIVVFATIVVMFYKVYLLKLFQGN